MAYSPISSLEKLDMDGFIFPINPVRTSESFRYQNLVRNSTVVELTAKIKRQMPWQWPNQHSLSAYGLRSVVCLEGSCGKYPNDEKANYLLRY